jgi:hypothetical protein
MNESTTIAKQIHLSRRYAERLNRLVQSRHISEDQLIEKALDIFFSLTDVFDAPMERRSTVLRDGQARLAEPIFKQRLLERGLLTEIKTPPSATGKQKNRALIQAQGKPLSQLIMEERR